MSSLCNACVSGSLHEGTPKGKIETINGVQAYIALPKGDYAKDKALLFLPDVYGVSLPNSQLLADAFASEGFPTYLLDYLHGDSVPLGEMEAGIFDLPKWLLSHTYEVTRPVIDQLMEGLKTQGITAFAATGYCFGGKYMIALAQDNLIKVGAASHPSLLKNPEDINLLLEKSKAPILINSCETDRAFPPEFQKATDEILGDGKYKPGYKRTYFEKAAHGFAIRGDLSDPYVKKAKEGAFDETVKWIKAYL